MKTYKVWCTNKAWHKKNENKNFEIVQAENRRQAQNIIEKKFPGYKIGKAILQRPPKHEFLVKIGFVKE